jgi:hypothetical protein
MVAIKFAELGSTGSRDMSWFQGLLWGKGRAPLRLAPTPRSGTIDGAVTPASLEALAPLYKRPLENETSNKPDKTAKHNRSLIRHINAFNIILPQGQ